MTACINLVATRCKNGDHVALLRWYNDHVHLLMGFPGLQQATLYRQSANPPMAAPEYTCLYEFSSHSDFLAFEHSDARARARQVVETGWAREGIEITQRTQYLRLGARRAGDGNAEEGALFTLQCLGLGTGDAQDVARWLSDSVHRGLAPFTHHHVAWYCQIDAGASGADALIVARVAAASGKKVLAPLWWQGAAGPEDVGAPPDPVVCRWTATYRQLLQWQR